MSADHESVLIVGAGIAGLGAALAFGDGRFNVTVLDRDPPPPDASPDEAFYSWERRGATQLRHSHVFLGRLSTLIRERYPALMHELLAAGGRIFNFEDALPPALQARYMKAEGDEDLSFLFSRRTTLELIMRRHAARLPGVTFVTDAGVRSLLAHRSCDTLIVDGVKVEKAGAISAMHAGVVIDASGRNSAFPDWLRAEGIEIAEEESPAGILYFTRHYRLRDGQDEPPRDGTPGAGDLGYIKFGVFVADNRHFSITLAVPEIETDLRIAIMRPEMFASICNNIPACRRWTDAHRSEPASQVFSMGNLKSVWRRFLKDDGPQVLGFFAIGDAAVRTNPLYGRGCSAGVMHAHIVRAAFDATADPCERAKIVERETFKALRPFYDTMVKQDRQSIRRAENERDPGHKPRLKARIVKSFVEDGLVPAMRGNLGVQRASARAFHMIGHPVAWLKEPRVLASIVAYWAMPKRIKRSRALYPPEFGPRRDEMLARLGLAA